MHNKKVIDSTSKLCLNLSIHKIKLSAYIVPLLYPVITVYTQITVKVDSTVHVNYQYIFLDC